MNLLIFAVEIEIQAIVTSLCSSWTSKELNQDAKNGDK